MSALNHCELSAIAPQSLPLGFEVKNMKYRPMAGNFFQERAVSSCCPRRNGVGLCFVVYLLARIPKLEEASLLP